jgi:outer membrane receptor protein involved in Fe transport
MVRQISGAFFRTAWVCAGVLVGSTCLAAQEPGGETSFELEPFTVTARRGGVSGPAVLPTLRLPSEGTRASVAVPADDLLREVPGFSLFRRTPSTAANPTTQGASLRGIGPSGTSRTLVLLDGVPINDAFGGWVYWSRLDLGDIEAIEVVRGGGSATWGNTALGGVIQFVTRPVTQSFWEAAGALGQRETRAVSLRAAEVMERGSVRASARYFSTEGYNRVRSDQRGAVDVPTGTRHRLVQFAADHAILPHLRLDVRGIYFEEDRGNGTPLSNNSTESARFHASLSGILPSGDDWQADAYAEISDYANTFTSVASDRNSEQLVLDQYRVPSRALGASLRRSGEQGAGRWTLGGDYRHVKGETRERVVFQGADRFAGGRISLLGAFGEYVSTAFDGWTWEVALRADYWQQTGGFLEQPNQPRQFFPSRSRVLPSGRVGFTRPLSEPVFLRGAVYQGFRVPTINELYRPFQVGADQTLANADLDPEELLGGEVGLDWFGPGARLRSTVFFNSVRDPIFNVTIGQSAQGGQLRQRQNVERTEIRGVEFELEQSLARDWQIILRYALSDARVRSAATQPALTGKRLAQVPRHVLTTGLGWKPANSPLSADLNARWNGAQFEDDLNARRLHGFLLVDIGFSWAIRPSTELNLRLDNALNRSYPDGITGANLVTEGAPRSWQMGLRHRF